MSTGQARPLSPSLIILYVNLALYAVCYQAQQPALPYILKNLSDDASSAFASFRSFFWGLQIVGSLISGLLIDSVGVKLVLILSFASSALSYAVTAYATEHASLALLWAGAIPTIFQHAMLGAKAYIALVTPEEGPLRGTLMAYTGVAYGVGMIAGPVVGGYLSSGGLARAAWVSSAGSMLSVVLVAFAISGPSSGTPTTSGSGSSTGASQGGLSWASMKKALASPTLAPLLFVKTMAVVSSAIFENGVRVVGEDRFGLDVTVSGRIPVLQHLHPVRP